MYIHTFGSSFIPSPLYTCASVAPQVGPIIKIADMYVHIKHLRENAYME
jgi:hypothetical protein